MLGCANSHGRGRHYRFVCCLGVPDASAKGGGEKPENRLILGSFTGKFAIIGGAVPWLLLANEEMPHVGTLDVDVGLDAEALGDGEYATLIAALQGHGYAQREGRGVTPR